ncbi:hypothetical protein V9T40_008401 [Parthenolecanium corni]|uniref:K Homology domain-containing protein n=1 Tax=Parthenolecanium corni TaxID=536013 RepID=A0AAN9TKT6_9HEMI
MAFNYNHTMNSDDPKTLNPGNPAYSYDEVFPALPAGVALSSKTKTSSGSEVIPPTVPKFSNQTKTPRISSSDVTTVFCVPAEERKYDHSDKFGEGESLRTCAQISKETGAAIEISTSKDKSLTFLISGKKNNVIEAKRKVLTNFQTQANVSISIPKEHHRWVLGKSGQRLKELEARTNTKISIPNIHDQSDKITVVGTRESIEKALHEIKVISDEQSKKAFERIKVPKIYYPFITGANNEKLNQLINETNTRINIPPPSVESDEITITGEKEGVENAKNRILQIYEEMEKTCQKISVQVPKWQHRYVIGPKRSTIAEILQDTGVSVEVPPAEESVDSITLLGPYKVLGEALKYLHAKATSMQCLEIDAPSRIRRLIIGKKGANIREIQDCFPQCHIEFMDDKIRIEGPPELIDGLKQKLQEKVDYYLNEYDTVELEVNRDHFKHIIGKSGANVNRLKNDHDVQITITEAESNSIRIEGSKESVAQVKRELEEQIEKLENEKERDIIISQKLHRTLFANKREKLKELQDKYKVIVIFPPSSVNSDVVKIKGQKDEVDACFKDLSKVVKELNENYYSQRVPIYKQFHKFIIGKGGNNIRKIRDETGTKIDLPAEVENNEMITITGKKEKVEEAKERILKIQNEMANIVNEEVSIPVKLHNSLFIGHRKLLQSIKDDCGGVLIKFPPLDKPSDKVLIRGPPEDVAKAKQQLLELAAEKQQSCHTLEVRARPDLHKFLIGKNGSRISKIREGTNTRIIFPNEGDDDKEVITIIGKKEDAEKAKEELETIIQQICNTVEQYVHVHPKYHKHFISNRGTLINKISEDCGNVIISFPRNMNHNDSKVNSRNVNHSDSKVIVKGNPEGVKEAIKTIESIVQDLENKHEDEVHVAPKYHKHFVSRKGEVLQNIVFECGGFDHVSISFPRTDIKDSRVVLKGVKESIQLAKTKILEIVKDLENQITIEVVIPNKDHRSLLRSRTYPTVDEIRKAHNVKITFPERINDSYQQNGPSEMNGYTSGEEKEQPKPCDIVHITGNPENCEAAKKSLLDIVPITLELEIPHTYHRSIIGTKGASIQDIITSYDVQVDVPHIDMKLDIIKIRGRPTSVENAKNAILKKKEEIEGEREALKLKSYEEKLDVPLEYHPQIIGRAGETINKIRKNYDVQISLPKKNEPDNTIITITGVQQSVESAKTEIMDIVQQLESRYKEKVTIDRRVHSRMIGAKGRQVKKIMSDYGVEIRFPRENDPDPNVVIVSGEEEKVLDCKDYLLNLEEDFLQDVQDEIEADGNGNTQMNKNDSGFVVKGGPWDQKAPDTSSISEFPSFGAVDGNKTFAQYESKSKTAWGPSRR